MSVREPVQQSTHTPYTKKELTISKLSYFNGWIGNAQMIGFLSHVKVALKPSLIL